MKPQLRRCTRKYCLAGHVKSVGILQPIEVFKNSDGKDWHNCQTCRDYNKRQAIIRSQPLSAARQKQLARWLAVEVYKPRPRVSTPEEIQHWGAGRVG